MDASRIAELLAPFLESDEEGTQFQKALSPGQLQSISTYINLLLRWNARINLTSVREPDEIVTRHFGESIFTARHLFPNLQGIAAGSSEAVGPHVIDFGAGAGFPGLPIKLWAAQTKLTLIEANQKKATFLREVVRSLHFSETNVFAGRAEGFPGPGGDVVTLRAVERFEASLSSAVKLALPGGRLAVLVGDSQLAKLPDGQSNVKWSKPLSLPLSTRRSLIIGMKTHDH